MLKKFYNFIFIKFSLLCIVISLVFLFTIFTSIISKGYKGFIGHYITLNIQLTPDETDDANSSNFISFSNAVNSSLAKIATKYNVSNIDDTILSNNYNKVLQNYLKNNPKSINTHLNIPILLATNADILMKGYKKNLSNLTDSAIKFLEKAKKDSLITSKFNWNFFVNNDSRFPEIAGIKGSLKGSFLIMLLTLVMSSIIGVATAIYIEEFVKKGPARSIIEVNINNLAAIPSIIFGLLGLSLFQDAAGVPRSSALIASLVLTLMVLPTVIVYSQIALNNVPNYIKEAAYGIGASKNQVIFKHVLPLALPGIITGLIIAISRTIGETAPLLIIGMFAFVSSSTFSLTDTSSTLPTQILMWFNMPELGFVEKTSAAIMVLLAIVITINLVASYVRAKLTKKL